MVQFSGSRPPKKGREISRERFTPKQTIGKLREAEVTLAQGRTAAQLCRTLAIAEQTFSRWGHKYAGLTVEQETSLKHFYDYLLRLSQKGPTPIISFPVISSLIHQKLRLTNYNLYQKVVLCYPSPITF